MVTFELIKDDDELMITRELAEIRDRRETTDGEMEYQIHYHENFRVFDEWIRERAAHFEPKPFFEEVQLFRLHRNYFRIGEHLKFHNFNILSMVLIAVLLMIKRR